MLALNDSSSGPPGTRSARFFGLPPSFLVALAVLTAGFTVPLYRWVQFALESDLFSYILLIPVVSLYLFLTGRRETEPAAGPGHPVLGSTLAIAGLGLLGAYGGAALTGTALVRQDAVALTILAYALLAAALAAFFLPQALRRTATFPALFLVFMAPFPVAMEHALEMFLQHGSAPPSYWFFKLAGTPVYRQDLIFQLPGITLQVAPECSGIRSTIVLFLTSLVASHLFLRSPWKKAILIGAVLPLALVRNGFRIFVIGELCVRVGPHMINSFVHKKGGPIFFALSLIPFSILVYFLVKSDRRQSTPTPSKPTP